METTAYYVALVTVVTVLPAVLSWLLIHPFIRHWRRVGPFGTYLAMGFFDFILMAGIFQIRGTLLSIRFGVRTPLVILAALLFGIAISIRGRVGQQFPLSKLLGMPEISVNRGPGKLVTGGIYSGVRNPRYLEVGFGIIAAALFCNYPAVYILFLVYITIIYLVVVLEERELRDRFGDEYKRYCEEVPRFVPRLRRGSCHQSNS